MSTYNAEAKEAAFKAWRKSGQNMEATLRELRKLGYMGISKPTLYAWKDEHNWEARAARADVEEHGVKDMDLNVEEMVIKDLLKQKKKYDNYFETLDEKTIDTQATYAYASLLKTIRDIQAKGGGADKATVILEVMNELVTYLMENDKDLAKRFDEHIEKFAARIKAKA